MSKAFDKNVKIYFIKFPKKNNGYLFWHFYREDRWLGDFFKKILVAKFVCCYAMGKSFSFKIVF